jgi:hypothetical protein
VAAQYDDHLIDAMAVRRERLVAALLYGPERLRRQWSGGLGSLAGGVFVAATICAGCVAVSWVESALREDEGLVWAPWHETIRVAAGPNRADQIFPNGAESSLQ